jgi:hypothetical protein
MKLKLSRRNRGDPSRGSEAREPSADSHMQWVLSQVGSVGWAVAGVPGDRASPPRAYSIGLWASYGQPDIALFGRPLRQLAIIARTLCQRVAGEEAFAVGDEIDDACPARLAIRRVDESWRTTPLFRASDRFHGYIRPPMSQVVWADHDGRFPWDRRYEPGLAGAQPLLWLPVDDHPPGPWTRLR